MIIIVITITQCTQRTRKLTQVYCKFSLKIAAANFFQRKRLQAEANRGKQKDNHDFQLQSQRMSDVRRFADSNKDRAAEAIQNAIVK